MTSTVTTVRPDVSLDDALAQRTGTALLTGNQALVRIGLVQQDRDRAAGLKTGGYISGYRGSPLGGYDQALGQAKKLLAERDIIFKPGLNEELAATAIWGSQQTGLYEPSRFDGVFGIWYGKGPGVDRAGDALKHGNLAGSARAGGVLVLAGDDHLCKSSTTAHQSEPALIAAGIPVLNPASVDELVSYGLHAIAMSRFSGAWVAMKCLTDVIDSTATINVDLPTHKEQNLEGALNIKAQDTPLEQERRLIAQKLPAAQEYARTHRLDRVTHGEPGARIGIVTTGKSWLDVRAALELLDIDVQAAGVAVYKVALVWPLEPEQLRAFVRGCSEIVVVEEKRGLIEEQIRTLLYALSDRPVVSGKRTPGDVPLFAEYGALDTATVARGLAARFADHSIAVTPPQLPAAVEADLLARGPWFCAGCPHNSSTKLPEGSHAGAGIGCHGLAMFNDAETTLPFTQMGGEGANWIGRAPFVDTSHIFQNLGDGTYSHSGLLAIRAAVAANVNITYKILFNDAVAMTGGQAHDAAVSPRSIVEQLLAEGVERVVIVADDLGRFADVTLPAGVPLHHRDNLDAVQREFRELPGVTAIVYDQLCATELRRHRKRGLKPKAAVRVHINPLVCEGCGDCGRVSNCVAIQPIDTAFGSKRQIDESSCNVDLSCLKGFCPSFITVPANTPAPKRKAIDAPPAMPNPVLPNLAGIWNIQMTGIGGTGVVTIGAILGMAAHLDGKSVRILDQTGMAQKNGGVASTVMIGHEGADLPSSIAANHADALLGFDIAGAASAKTAALLDTKRTIAILNRHVAPPGVFTRAPDLVLDAEPMIERVARRTRAEALIAIDSTGSSMDIFGEATYANMLLLGLAWQRGAVPIAHAALMRAIEMNGVAVDANKTAFAWGRAQDGATAAEKTAIDPVETRATFLADYGGTTLARDYRRIVAHAERIEQAQAPGSGIALALAGSLFKLSAIKDEYEVARLLTLPDELTKLGPGARPTFWMAPPLFARRDPATGHPRKRAFGPWMLPVLKLLARASVLRGTPLDIFGYTSERQEERDDLQAYRALVDATLPRLTRANAGVLAKLYAQPLALRGYGHVKAANRETMLTQRAELLVRLNGAS